MLPEDKDLIRASELFGYRCETRVCYATLFFQHPYGCTDVLKAGGHKLIETGPYSWINPFLADESSSESCFALYEQQCMYVCMTCITGTSHSS